MRIKTEEISDVGADWQGSFYRWRANLFSTEGELLASVIGVTRAGALGRLLIVASKHFGVTEITGDEI
jgi:hypothetical protein